MEGTHNPVPVGKGDFVLPPKPGGAADVTIIDYELRWTYDVNRLLSKSRNSPFDGRTFTGSPIATIVSGSIGWQRE